MLRRSPQILHSQRTVEHCIKIDYDEADTFVFIETSVPRAMVRSAISLRKKNRFKAFVIGTLGGANWAALPNSLSQRAIGLDKICFGQ